MPLDGFDWYKLNYLIGVYLISLLTGIILIVDTAKPIIPASNRQMCTKIPSILLSGKHHTHQTSSNITYVSRAYAQSFLAYSPLDDMFIFVEPKYQLHLYSAQSVRLIGRVTTTTIVYAASCTSITSGDYRDLCFVYESRSKVNLISIRVCEVRFNSSRLAFEDKKCIETTIRYDLPSLRINGFTIKRDHAGTKKSLLFISTNVGLIYTIFDMRTYVLTRKPVILNETLTEGSVVMTSSDVLYYANKQDHTIHEIHITRDFRIRYGKIIKSNAIRSPFGLITDECNHLYIATKSMILIMFMQTYTTIRGIFSKPSDLPITMERINATSYMYVTVKKSSGKIPSIWMFNFFSFSEADKTTTTTRRPVIRMNKIWTSHGAKIQTTNKPVHSSMLKLLSPSSFTSATTKSYSHSSHTRQMSRRTYTTDMFRDKAALSTQRLSSEHPTSITSDEFHDDTSDTSVSLDHSLLLTENDPFSQNIPTTINPSELLTSDDGFILDYQDKIDLSLNENSLSQLDFSEQLSTESPFYQQDINYSTDPMELMEFNYQNLSSTSSTTPLYTLFDIADSSTDTASDDQTTVTEDTIAVTATSDEISQFSTLTSLLSTLIRPTTNQYHNTDESTEQTIDTDIERSTISPSAVSTEDSTEYRYSSSPTTMPIETTLMTSPVDVTPLSSFFVEESSIIDPTDQPVTQSHDIDSRSSVIPSTVSSTGEKHPPEDELNIVTQSTQRTVESSSTAIDSISFNETLETTSEYLLDTDTIHSASSEQLVSHIDDEQTDSFSSNHNHLVMSTFPDQTVSSQDHSLLTSTESAPHNANDNSYDASQLDTNEPINIIENSTLPMIITDSISRERADGNSQNDSFLTLAEVNVSSTLHPSSSLFIVSSTTLVPSHSSYLSSLPHSSLASHSSTTSTKVNSILSSKHFSVPTTTEFIPVTTQSSSISTLQTSTPGVTSRITEQSSMFTSSTVQSSLLTTLYSTHSSMASTLLSTTTNTPSTSSSSPKFFQSSLAYRTTSEPSTTEYETFMTTIATSTNVDSTATTRLEEWSTLLLRTTENEESTSISDSPSSDTTLISSTFLPPTTDTYSERHTSTPGSSQIPSTFSSSTTDQYTEEYSSLQSSLEVSSTISSLPTELYSEVYSSTQSSSEVSTTDEYSEGDTSTQSALATSSTFSASIATEYPEEYTSPQFLSEETSSTFSDEYTSETEHTTVATTNTPSRSNRPTRRRTSRPTTSSTIVSTMRTTAIPSRTRRILHVLTTMTPFLPITSLSTKLTTTLSTLVWYSKFDPLQQQPIIFIKPPFNSNSSNALLSNELFHKIFNGTSNSSTNKLLSFNLSDLPPSSWNLSLHTNESVLLDITLPSSSSHSSDSDTKTNLTITNIDANRFSTNIVGSSINLQVDQIQAKQFSLAMNLTSNSTNQTSSDVIIGHIRSEQFQLDITKSDNMNLHVEQVDSETAELFFDSNFCTSDTNLQINLNLSKNGTIRFGNQPPLRIGPVFTRVHMLKQSCHLDQPFTLFFDICQGQNPCLNGGTCKSQVPDYDHPSYSPQEPSEISYQCICPMYISGEQCEQSQYPSGYCINGGNLTFVLNANNKSVEQCSCAQGFEGHHCEENVDDCVGVTCSTHGICQDGLNEYTCSCYDGFYGSRCEQKSVETVLLQVATKSFATVAIMLIAGIASLVVASDIHTFLTRKKERRHHEVNRLPRVSSELYENSVLLLGFSEAPIEMNDPSMTTTRRRKKKTTTTTKRQHPVNGRKQSNYRKLSKRKHKKTVQNTSSKHNVMTNPAYETIL